MGILYVLGFISAKVYTYLSAIVVVSLSLIEYGFKYITNRDGLRGKDRAEKNKILTEISNKYAKPLGFKSKFELKKP